MSHPERPSRVVIERLRPEVDGGRFAAKATAGGSVRVTADVFTDGHDSLAARLLYRRRGESIWSEAPMTAGVNDEWCAEFPVPELGFYEFTAEAWVDHFASWQGALRKKVDAGQDVSSELLEGAALVGRAASRATGADGDYLRGVRAELSAPTARPETGLSRDLAAAMRRHPDRSGATRYRRELCVEAERERASFGAWYEMFPRSAASEPGRHGTFADCEARLPYVAGMGFDVLYLPPIHPIGHTHRKGRNNAPAAEPDDPGSPWGIGGPEGGHTAVHPALGTLADFERLVRHTRELGMEVALDLAFQCSPDHPWVREHPEWFRHRPDGTIHYAENPPKKYQDIYPLDFESDEWKSLWAALLGVVLFWAERGVRIFRVDNPHTKPFRFWEWLIRESRGQHPDLIFLAEAFTRPKVMRRLAKSGFSQSYTYFTWRNTKAELTEYLEELHDDATRAAMRPNLFVNTPDILHEFLQFGGPAAFRLRLVLAATLAGNYGIYGPPFELCIGDGLPDSEEYRSSEKYEVRHWDLADPQSLRPLIARMNEIRRTHRAFRHDERVRFHPVDNDQLLFFSRGTPDGSEVFLIVVNLDPHQPQSGWLEVPLRSFGLDESDSYQVHDLLADARYLWSGSRNYVALDPSTQPAHVFRLRRRVSGEQGFEYYA